MLKALAKKQRIAQILCKSFQQFDAIHADCHVFTIVSVVTSLPQDTKSRARGVPAD